MTPQLMENLSEVTEFLLVGLTDALEMQVPLFTIFALIYLTTLVGNLGMIVLILLDSRLHTPMYFFLGNLSLVDCVYASSVTPKVMAGILTGDKIISYDACATQMFFFAAFATVESFLLASMAFDRQAAVCKPLHYTTTVTRAMCALLATSSYVCDSYNLPSMLPSLSTSPSAIPTWLITFSVTFPHCWLSLALISTQTRLCSSHWQRSTPCSLFWLSWARTSSSLLLS